MYKAPPKARKRSILSFISSWRKQTLISIIISVVIVIPFMVGITYYCFAESGRLSVVILSSFSVGISYIISSLIYRRFYTGYHRGTSIFLGFLMSIPIYFLFFVIIGPPLRLILNIKISIDFWIWISMIWFFTLICNLIVIEWKNI
jgi:hypothetical protein